MSLALISRRDRDWSLSFYARTSEGARLMSRVTCCWDSILIILDIRERNGQADRLAATARDVGQAEEFPSLGVGSPDPSRKN